MKRHLIYVSLIISAGLLGCGHHDETEAKLKTVAFAPPVVKQDAEVADKSADPPVADVANAVSVPHEPALVKDTAKKIIKTGEISFETRKLDTTRRSIIRQLQKLDGYVADDTQSINSSDNRKEFELKIRIPAKNFDVFVDSVCSGAYKIDSKHIATSDITTEYIDMNTRLQNKKILESRYLDLLKKATRMIDMLAIENKLSDIRGEIESEQGQFNYMSRQVAFSSLDINFYTLNSASPETGKGFGYRFIHALTNGFDWLKDMIFGLIATWPLWIGVLVATLLIRRYFRRRREVSPL